MKTITLLTSGTRGDVMTYIALGLGLRDAGYHVRITAPLGFAQFVATSGLEFAGFEGNPSDLMINQSDPLTFGRSIFQSIRATLDFLDKARDIYVHMLHTAANVCRGSDMLVYSLPALWGAHIAEGLRIPAIRGVIEPLTPTREFSSTLLPFRLNFFGIGNWFSHWMMTQAIWLAWRDEINRSRRADFNLPRAHWLDPTLRSFPDQPLTLNGFSEHIVPRPRDWNEKQIITGYWRYREVNDFSEQQAIQRFIERAPEKTIAVGLGSPGTKDFVSFINILDEALKQSDTQAVLTIPKAWHTKFISTRILPVEYVPHGWLYQQVKVAVHHGGSGTTSASLHAGIPSVILPMGVDQFFWGERVYKLGAGPKPVPQRALNAKKLANAIQQSLWDETMRARAKLISEALCLEDGVEATVRLMREII